MADKFVSFGIGINNFLYGGNVPYFVPEKSSTVIYSCVISPQPNATIYFNKNQVQLTYITMPASGNVNLCDIIGKIVLNEGEYIHTNAVYCTCQGIETSFGTPSMTRFHTFPYTGTEVLYTVPANKTSIIVKMWGAAGATSPSTTTNTGGSGGYIGGTITVTPGEVLKIKVGGSGSTAYVTGFNSNTILYGFGGGGQATIPGGGASWISKNDNTPILVAGGGGGGPNNISLGQIGRGGGGGGLIGQPGIASSNTQLHGGGGTQSSGGAAYGASPATSGSLGQGGTGSTAYGGSGGGGGYYGGGGTYSNAGGGGGSSYANPSFTSNIITSSAISSTVPITMGVINSDFNIPGGIAHPWSDTPITQIANPMAGTFPATSTGMNGVIYFFE